MGNDLGNSEVSFYLSKKAMKICFENPIMNDEIAKNLLIMVDWLIAVCFFNKNALRNLWWCAHYMLDRRTITYRENEQILKKTEVVDFYWFNHHRNRL